MPDRLSSEHQTIIERGAQEWRRKLTDRSRNNKLLYYRERGQGMLALSKFEPQAFNDLMAGERLPLASLVTDRTASDIAQCLSPIRQRALKEQKERGLSTLFLAIGMASWTVTDSKGPPAASVLLVPVSIHGDTHLQRGGEVHINPVLLQVLETERQCSVKAYTLLDDPEDNASFALSQFFRRFEAEACRVPGFAIDKRYAVLDNFCFHKSAMVADLEAHSKVLADSPVIALLAGISEQTLPGSSRSKEAYSPLEAFLVLKADSSQKKVIQAVLEDQPLTVIQGPPGTGKSQTIANLIAVLAAKGQRVLFVAQKQAALEAVQRNLQGVGLEHLLLNLHSNDSRHQVIKQFADSWDRVQRTPPAPPDTIQPQITKKVKTLRQLSRRLHDPQPLTGKSIYAMQAELLQFAAEEQVSVRFSSETLKAMDNAAVTTIEADLHEVGSDALLSRLFLGTTPSVWLQEASLPSEPIAQQLFGTVKQLLNEQWPACKDALTVLLKDTGLKAPETLHQASECLDPPDKRLLPQVRQSQYLRLAGKFIWERSLLRWCRLQDAGKVASEPLLEDVTSDTEQARQQRSLFSHPAVPCEPDAQSAVRAQLHALMEQLAFIQPYLKRPALHLLPFDDLLGYLKRLAAETTEPAKLARVQAITQNMDLLGAGALLVSLRQAQPEPQLWVRQFRYAWLRSHLEVALDEQPLLDFFEPTAAPLQAFERQSVEQDIQALRRLSEQQRQTAIDRLCAAHAQSVIIAMDDNPEQEDNVKSELKKTRHKPLRPFLGAMFDVLTRLRPCWMMSPLSVSELLDLRCQFDVVIFDEASQIRVEEAVPAILRGSQIVVTGDQAQLPPLHYGESAQQRSQSLLERLAAAVTSHSLQWHYRSDDERLIAFSNRTFYGNRLITFPSAFQESPLSHFVVQQSDHQGPSGSPKAFYVDVVKLLLQPDERVLCPAGSLLITTGLNQATLLKQQLDSHSKTRATSISERFLVKNLQGVQGDESDVVIWLLGYGRNRSGSLRHNFGSLLLEGGERHLNVATTRARKRMLVFSSFSPHELKPEQCAQPRAASLFKQYLEYVDQEQTAAGTALVSEVALDSFETDVFNALTARGLKLIPLIGKSEARIRLAVVHPNRPERLVLAIDTDGLHHQALLDLQDQYLLWSEQLEQRGFRLHRLWSTDWFLHREAAITQTLQAFQQAVTFADESDAAPPSSTRGAATGPGRKPDTAIPRPRDACPPFLKRKPAQNVDQDLAELLRWIEADGLRRTKKDLLEAMKAAMQKGRDWKQIGKDDELLRAAIEQYRSPKSHADAAGGTNKRLMGPVKMNRLAK